MLNTEMKTHLHGLHMNSLIIFSKTLCPNKTVYWDMSG